MLNPMHESVYTRIPSLEDTGSWGLVTVLWDGPVPCRAFANSSDYRYQVTAKHPQGNQSQAKLPNEKNLLKS